MMTKDADKKREQMQMFCMDDMLPSNHMLRLIDKAINWSVIYDLVENKYSADNGRPSMDPVMLIKIPFIQYLYGIKSMRQTIKEIEVNVAYRWFLGLDMLDPVPHFSTFGENYTRRFKETDLFEQIFTKILEDCMKFNLVDTSTIFVDATHVKACANSKKMRKRIATQQALWYEDELQKEISMDRERHGKRPLKNKDDNDKTPPMPGGSGTSNGEEDIPDGVKTQKCSSIDPESGWFRKGEHKHVFAYGVQTACDKHGWILDFSVHPGNEHDSRTFKSLYDKLKKYTPSMLVADAGYKTPAIARTLIEDEVKPLFPYKRPMTKKGFFKKYEYVYDEYYDCYICPENRVLEYSTTNRDGYREYKSKSCQCENCPSIKQCTGSKDHVKVVTRHVWEEYMEQVEELRCTRGNKPIYAQRKETIERIFGTAKEQHGFRYTQCVGKAQMNMKVALTFACMNLKKLAGIMAKQEGFKFHLPHFFAYMLKKEKKNSKKEKWCWSNAPVPTLSTV
ncbi:IS1182 family transposase [Lachnospiraceae bacterium OttesenSCG-928-E19]|nr:IS1182 family transposase [Lachnospiraceae bacterium OttesenSCG-928-E19]